MGEGSEGDGKEEGYIGQELMEATSTHTYLLNTGPSRHVADIVQSHIVTKADIKL